MAKMNMKKTNWTGQSLAMDTTVKDRLVKHHTHKLRVENHIDEEYGRLVYDLFCDECNERLLSATEGDLAFNMLRHIHIAIKDGLEIIARSTLSYCFIGYYEEGTFKEITRSRISTKSNWKHSSIKPEKIKKHFRHNLIITTLIDEETGCLGFSLRCLDCFEEILTSYEGMIDFTMLRFLYQQSKKGNKTSFGQLHGMYGTVGFIRDEQYHEVARSTRIY